MKKSTNYSQSGTTITTTPISGITMGNSTSAGGSYLTSIGSTQSTVPPYWNSGGSYIPKKPTFSDYQKKIKESERLQLTLKLLKEDKIDIDQALELISSDIQFLKQEVDNRFIGYSQTGTTTWNNPGTFSTPTMYNAPVIGQSDPGSIV